MEKAVQDLVWPRGWMWCWADLGKSVDFGDSSGSGDQTKPRRSQARSWALGRVHAGENEVVIPS